MAAAPPPPPPIYNLHNAGYFTQQIINDINMRYPALMAPYTDVAIRRAYRELARVWHPDHAAPPGTPPVTLEIINSNFQFLQTARDNLLLAAAAGLAPGAPAPPAAPPPPNLSAQRRRDEYMGMPEFLRYLKYYRVPQSSVDNPVLLDSWINDYMEATGFKPLERKFETTASKLQHVPAMSQFLTLASAQPYSKTETAQSWRPQPTFDHVILTYAAQNPQGRRNFDGLYTYYSSQVLRPLSREEFNNVLIKFIRENRRKDMNDLVGGSINKRRKIYSKRLNNKRKSSRKKNKTGKKYSIKRNRKRVGGGRLPVFQQLAQGKSISQDADPDFWRRKGVIDQTSRDRDRFNQQTAWSEDDTDSD